MIILMNHGIEAFPSEALTVHISRSTTLLAAASLSLALLLTACTSETDSHSTEDSINNTASSVNQGNAVTDCECVSKEIGLDFSRVAAGSVKTGGIRTAIRSAVDNIPFVESTYSSTVNTPGKITITQPYCISTAPVSAQLYCEFVNAQLPASKAFVVHINPKFHYIAKLATVVFDEATQRFIVPDEHADEPVNTATFVGAQKFCEWLSDQTGCAVRLPTEGEWVVAADALGWNDSPAEYEMNGLGYWTTDYWSPTLSYIVNVDDPQGPPKNYAEAAYSWKDPHRVIRYIDGLGFPPRTGEPGISPSRTPSYGFRVVMPIAPVPE
jgi:formylglycine-generating enzyme required for sulfatase activity